MLTRERFSGLMKPLSEASSNSFRRGVKRLLTVDYQPRSLARLRRRHHPLHNHSVITAKTSAGVRGARGSLDRARVTSCEGQVRGPTHTHCSE